MEFKSLLGALLSGIAVFLVVGVAVTEFAQPWIEFSLFLGIPAGLAAGVFTAGAVYLGLADDAPASRRRVAGAFAAFGVAFLVLLVTLGWVVNVGVTTAIIVSLLVALVVAAVAYRRGATAGGETPSDDDLTSRAN
jgi:MFS-type transporter involved in bile tolerance (Atg22 family)